MPGFPKRIEAVQRRLRFFDFSLDNLGIVDRDGVLLDLNHSWRDVFGFDLDHFKSRPFLGFVHPDDRDKSARALDALLPDDTDERRLRNRVLCRDHSYRWMLWSCRQADDVLYLLGRDVHWLTGESRRVNDARTVPEREPGGPTDKLDLRFAWRRQRFFDFSLDLLCIATSQGYFVDLNPSWEHTLGYTLDELMSRPFLEFVHPKDQEPTLAEAARLQEPGTYTVGFANRYRCKDGSYRWLHWVSRVVEGYFYAVARDITQLAERAKSEDLFAIHLEDPEMAPDQS